MEKVNNTPMLSGILIGIGVIINTLSSNKYIGAMLFSFALLSIIKLDLQLYTGQIGYIINKKYSVLEYLLMLSLNILGAGIPTFLVFPFQDKSIQDKFIAEY